MGIEVILVEPGATRTPIWDKCAALTTGNVEGADPERVALYKGLRWGLGLHGRLM